MEEYIKGMDISFVPQNEERGMVVRDFDGTAMDVFELIKKYGVNSIRLRLWNEPENFPESGGYCNLRYTMDMARRIKKQGMSFMLDFHYSDWWADPGNQRKPKAWEKLKGRELEHAVYSFTKETLESLKAEGLMPDIVQIGNEIRSGLIFPDGELPDYEGMVRLVNAGIRGAREVAGKDELQVMIHLDQGGRYTLLKEWFDKAFEYGLADFDLIGLSYYPFWHGTFRDLKDTMERLLKDYNKPIMIVETAYAWRRSAHGFIDDDQIRIAGVEATPEGQLKVLELVNRIVDSLPNNMGKGVYYWEPMCVPYRDKGGWEENMGLLDEDGKVYPAIRAFLYSREQKDEQRLTELMQEVTAAEEASNAVDEDFDEENLLKNADFSCELENWQVEASEGVAMQIQPVENGEKDGRSIRVESLKNFTFSIMQHVDIKENGKYALKVEFQGTDTTNVDVRLIAKTASGWYWERVIHPSEHGFTAYAIRNIACGKEKLTVGIKIVSPPMYCLLKEFRLVKLKEI